MFGDNSTKSILGKNKDLFLKWGAFALFFAYFWRTYNIFTDIPAYGDSLEVVWGILWYNHALVEWVNPFHYPLIFHPEGWQVGILAHTPLLFLLAQPFYLLGGEVFAYNMIAIIPFFISYIGALRFFKHYTKSPLTAVAVSLAFTFVAMRSSRVWGHLHILWATSLLPWMGHHLIQWREKDEPSIWAKDVLMSGLYFGLMISFSLYSVFLAPIAFLLLERKLIQWRKIPQFILLGGIALLVGSTALLPYLLATRNQPIAPADIHALTFWSASINSLFIPSIFHSIPVVRQFANSLHPSFGGEARTMNMGMLTLFLILASLYYWRGAPKKKIGHFLVFLVGLIFALGPILKYDGRPVEVSFLEGINEFLWGLGRSLKPEVFITDETPAAFLQGIPLPSYLLIILIPFWEGARTTARFAMASFLGALGLVAEGIDRLPRLVRVLLMVFWLIEMLPIQTSAAPLSLTMLHPAHEWLTAQTLQPGEGVLDLQSVVMYGAEPLYISWQTQQPTAASIGSFLPEQNQFLHDQIGDWTGRQPEDLVKTLQSYNIRYLVLHNNRDKSKAIWEHIQAAPNQFTDIGCFDPPADYKSPWTYPICIAEVNAHSTVSNVYPVYGFSDTEPWGIWSIEDRPRFSFIATAQKDYMLQAEVFPHCLDGRFQKLKLVYHEQVLHEVDWENCDPISLQVILPKEHTEIGNNEVHFELEYAISPAELETGNDPRKLGVGFSRFQIKPIE